MLLTATTGSARGAMILLGVLLACQAGAEPSTSPTSIYVCTDANGKRITSDRPIPECSTREQRILNPDGSPKGVRPPTPTAEERAEMEARERDAMAERVARQDAIRRDRNLLARFPDEAAHRKAREAALDDVRKAVRNSEIRVATLVAERKPLQDEAEFYVGKALPLKLRNQLDGNDAAAEAQRNLIQNQQAEVVRINRRYDAELARLKRLWAGAPPGSLGVMPAATAMAGSGVSTTK